MKVRHKTAFAVVSAAALLVVGTGGAVSAKALITGDDIKNNTVTGSDIKNHSIHLADIHGHDLAALQAQRGEKGDQGVQGVKGEKGEKGEPGAKGATGDQGLQGLKGDQGIQGPKGDPGTNGTNGNPGPQGPPGLSNLIAGAGYTTTWVGDEGATLQTAREECPAGMYALGGGFSTWGGDKDLGGDNKNIQVTVSAPYFEGEYIPVDAAGNFRPTEWVVKGYNNGTTDQIVRAWVTCANVAAVPAN